MKGNSRYGLIFGIECIMGFYKVSEHSVVEFLVCSPTANRTASLINLVRMP